jgi:hypothetical protein
MTTMLASMSFATATAMIGMRLLTNMAASKPIPVRIDPDIIQAITPIAAEQGRSVTKQVNHDLRKLLGI